jgi:MFS family permease
VLALVRDRNLGLRLLGGATSVLGDQFNIVALPWLVIRLTGDALAVGFILALAALPRAAFMLVGGAVSDRFSPRLVMLYSNIARGILVGLLSALVLLDLLPLWALYLISLGYGLADGFFYPAQNAVLPQIVPRERLEMGNGLAQGTAQVASFLGPILAGGIIASLSHDGPPGSAERLGLAVVFALDAVSFFVAAALLGAIRVGAGAPAPGGSVWADLRVGLHYVGRDPGLRLIFLTMAVIVLVMYGPMVVGVPVLATTHFPEGAAAFGAILSAWGGGTLLGSAVAILVPAGSPVRLGLLLPVLAILPGAGLAIIGVTHLTWLAALASLAMGAAAGYLGVLFITWLQLRTPREMIGRMMGLMNFASVGLTPLSLALAGLLVGAEPAALFIGAGSLITLVVLVAALHPAVRALAAEQPSP